MTTEIPNRRQPRNGFINFSYVLSVLIAVLVAIVELRKGKPLLPTLSVTFLLLVFLSTTIYNFQKARTNPAAGEGIRKRAQRLTGVMVGVFIATAVMTWMAYHVFSYSTAFPVAMVIIAIGLIFIAVKA